MNGGSLEEKTSLQRKEGTYELPEITEDMVCPTCQKSSVHLSRTIYKLPDGDEILILLLECEKCGYKKTDTIPMLNAFQPGVYHLNVDDSDFSHKVFRGATGDLEIPEIGISIERGPAATFDFTNIEGILLKIQQRVEFFLDTSPKNSQEWMHANEAKKRLFSALKGNLPFTVILTDYEGGSYIKPTNAQKMQFTKLPQKS